LLSNGWIVKRRLELMDFFGVDLGEPRMEPDNGWGSTAQPTPKHLLLALELCQSIAQARL
jgi:hypothetical protein